MLGWPVGFDSNHKLFGSVEKPALTLGLFLVLDVVRLLLPHSLDSDEWRLGQAVGLLLCHCADKVLSD